MAAADTVAPLTRALRLARGSFRAGNFPVGAVVIGPAGELIASASNRAQSTGSPLGHAETRALARATRALARAEPDSLLLATSAEPCLMCLGAVLNTPAIGTVVWAAGPASQAGSAIASVRRSRYRHPRLATIRVIAEPHPELRRESRALLHRWCVEHDDPRAAMFDDHPGRPR